MIDRLLFAPYKQKTYYIFKLNENDNAVYYNAWFCFRIFSKNKNA